MARVPSRGSEQFVVRMPDGLRDRIARAADLNGRSMNAEIVDCLETKFPPDPPDHELFEEIEYLLASLRNTPTPKLRISTIRALQEARKRMMATNQYLESKITEG